MLHTVMLMEKKSVSMKFDITGGVFRMTLKGLRTVITVARMYNDCIIYYNSVKNEFFVTEHEIIYPYDGLYCITAMMIQQGYRFDGTMKGLKIFMDANEHYFKRKEVK